MTQDLGVFWLHQSRRSTCHCPISSGNSRMCQQEPLDLLIWRSEPVAHSREKGGVRVSAALPGTSYCSAFLPLTLMPRGAKNRGLGANCPKLSSAHKHTVQRLKRGNWIVTNLWQVSDLDCPHPIFLCFSEWRVWTSAPEASDPWDWKDWKREGPWQAWQLPGQHGQPTPPPSRCTLTPAVSHLSSEPDHQSIKEKRQPSPF